MLAKAIEIAAKYHANQVDLNNEPYILHPLRVMLNFHDEPAQVVSVLHDVCEDTRYTLPHLAEDVVWNVFTQEIYQAVEAITHFRQEPLECYWARVLENPLALRVKLKDIDDNVSRLPQMTDKQHQEKLIKKYERAYKFFGVETSIERIQ